VAQRLAELQRERAAAYAAAATTTIDTTDLDTDAVVAAVLAWAKRKPGLLSRDELAL
jgi:hypothetical protein